DGLPEEERPSQSIFRLRGYGSRKNQEVLALLEKSTVVEKEKHIQIDSGRLYRAFERAIREAEEKKEKASLRQIIDRAHAIYCEGLPVEERPSQSTFRLRGYGSDKNQEVFALLEKSTVVEKEKHIQIDSGRLRRAFERAIREA